MGQADELTDSDFSDNEIKIANFIFSEMNKLDPEFNLVAPRFDGAMIAHISGYFDLRIIAKSLKDNLFETDQL